MSSFGIESHRLLGKETYRALHDSWPPSAQKWLDQVVWLSVTVLEKTEHGWPAECMEWPYRRTSYGYGYVLFPVWAGADWPIPLHFPVTKAVYEYAHGPTPRGISIRQSCGNHACFNLTHLQGVQRGK